MNVKKLLGSLLVAGTVMSAFSLNAGATDMVEIPEFSEVIENPEVTEPVEAFMGDESEAAVRNGWVKGSDGKDYWYENGVKQGTEGRGKEIYDPGSNAWYWLDSIQGGAKAVSKDVYQESLAGTYGEKYVNGQLYGKWVRYDENGHMIKGWSDDGLYYFDETYGTMTKGYRTIDGIEYYFDPVTSICQYGMRYPDGFNQIGNKEYWFKNGVREGYTYNKQCYRGKEIYDPATDAWYWLDNVQDGAKALGKDVYQESLAGPHGEFEKDGQRYGKWVHYDGLGGMIKGWYRSSNGALYFFDRVYGTMVKGDVVIDGIWYHFNEITGVVETPVNLDACNVQHSYQLYFSGKSPETLSCREWTRGVKYCTICRQTVTGSMVDLWGKCDYERQVGVEGNCTTPEEYSLKCKVCNVRKQTPLGGFVFKTKGPGQPNKHIPYISNWQSFSTKDKCWIYYEKKECDRCDHVFLDTHEIGRGSQRDDLRIK